MADPADAISAHPVWDRIAGLERRADEVDRAKLPGDAAEALRRLRDVLTYVRSLLGGTDRRVVSAEMLQPLLPHVATLTQALTQYGQDSNPGHFRRISGYCDALLADLRSIPPPAPDDEVRATREQAQAVGDRFDELVARMREEVETLGRSISEWSDRVQKAETSLSESARQFQERLDGLRTSITEQSTRLDEALNSFSSESRDRLTKVQNAFSKAQERHLSTAKEELDGALADLKSRTTKELEVIARRTDEAVMSLEESEERVSGLVKVVTATALAGGFAQDAERERRTADRWRLGAVGCFVAIVGIGAWLVIATAGAGELDVGQFAAKVFLTLPLTVLAAYAGSQSASHRRTERRARRTELHLAALEPYVESLGDQEAAKVRAEFAAHVFGPLSDDHSDGRDDTVSPKALLQLLEKAVQANTKR